MLGDVAAGAPVFVANSGRYKHAIVDIKDYEKTQATLHLVNEPASGRKSGEQEGWLEPEDLRVHFRTEAETNRHNFHGYPAIESTHSWEGYPL